MTPQIIHLRDILEETANDLNQVSCTLELLLTIIYEADEESPQREALSLLWKNLLSIRDRVCETCMDADLQKALIEAQTQINRMYLLNDSGYGCCTGFK